MYATQHKFQIEEVLSSMARSRYNTPDKKGSGHQDDKYNVSDQQFW